MKKLVRIAMMVVVSSALLVACGGSDKSNSSEKSSEKSSNNSEKSSEKSSDNSEKSSEKSSDKVSLEQRANELYKEWVAAYDRGDGSKKKIEQQLDEYVNTLSDKEKEEFNAMFDAIEKEYTASVRNTAIDYATRISNAESNGAIQEAERLCLESYNYSANLKRYYLTVYTNTFDETRASYGYSDGGCVQGVSQSPYYYN